MNDQQRAHIALNLSYVLHERSDSATVQRFIKSMEAEQRRCARAIRELARLSDDELTERVIVVDQTDNPGTPARPNIPVVTVNIGAIELLPRLLNLAGYWRPGAETIARILDNPQSRDERSPTFFGAPAALNVAEVPAQRETRWHFATAVLRPGFKTILLRVAPLGEQGTTERPDWVSATRLAEQAIREFPLQWWCTRPLWERPTEETLPEFRITENGATTCGR